MNDQEEITDQPLQSQNNCLPQLPQAQKLQVQQVLQCLVGQIVRLSRKNLLIGKCGHTTFYPKISAVKSTDSNPDLDFSQEHTA